MKVSIRTRAQGFAARLAPAFIATVVAVMLFGAASGVPSMSALAFASEGDRDGDEQGQVEDEVDHVELAGLLLRDGHLDRASAELDEVDTAAEGIDVGRYYALRGGIAMQRGQHGAGRQEDDGEGLHEGQVSHGVNRAV